MMTEDGKTVTMDRSRQTSFATSTDCTTRRRDGHTRLLESNTIDSSRKHFGAFRQGLWAYRQIPSTYQCLHILYDTNRVSTNHNSNSSNANPIPNALRLAQKEWPLPSIIRPTGTHQTHHHQSPDPRLSVSAARSSVYSASALPSHSSRLAAGARTLPHCLVEALY
jgi:hypothetical protein